MPFLSTSSYFALAVQPIAGIALVGAPTPVDATDAVTAIPLADDIGADQVFPVVMAVEPPMQLVPPSSAFLSTTSVASYGTVVPAKISEQVTEELPPEEEEEAEETETNKSGFEAIREELQLLRQEIEKQRVTITAQQNEINELKMRQASNFDLAMLRGAGIQQGGTIPQTGTAPQAGAGSAAVSDQVDVQLPDAPVGEAPPEQERPSSRATVVVPEGQGVLTPKGQFMLDPSFSYTSSSTNRLVFRGIELVPGIQIGLIEASDADRDTISGNLAIRYGLTNRLEIEGRVPVLYRSDRIQVAQQRDEGIVRQIKLQDEGIGDIEFGLRYQVNQRKAQNPIWIAGLRVKSDTGRGPFDVGFDEFGVATGLATGSGFWGIQPSLNMLLPSDPAVIFGGVSFLYHLPRDIDRIVGDAPIGHVDPGDAASANLGFGFALNPRFSFSLGYRHNYIFPTETEIAGAIERSSRTQVGSFTFGMSYRLSERNAINFGVEVGATADAPDLGITLRMPLRFGDN